MTWPVFISRLMLVSVYVVFVSTFLIAYFTQQKAVTIYINIFGEANLELLLLVLTFPFIVLDIAGWFEK